jgi:hypothetical protein
MYLFIYPRWRTFGGRQQCALSRLNNATRPFKEKMSALATRTRSLYKYDVYYSREKKKERKSGQTSLPTKGAH